MKLYIGSDVPFTQPKALRMTDQRGSLRVAYLPSIQ